ncbi:MAG TPA: SMP-30/gluconolactonase/LRE family protein [Polyangiales bacterium]|nr:SMP-30/gluconolactonase/LRE family protein [Polyangiales bacterium]
MAQHDGRYTAARPLSLAEGWTVQRVLPPSRLFGANGLRTGPDGRVYVAQVTGSQISALDLETGKLETISPKGGDIVGPDDLAFDSRGNLYATEVMDGRVSVRGPDGRTRVLRDDVPNANGITVHQDRLFVGELRIGGRLLELDLQGGAPRVLLENVPMPNAMEVGPDGYLYFPVMGANEIWRISPNGGAAERVAEGLGVPDAVKFDSKGNIVSTQVHSGEVLRIDPRTGARTVLARLEPGLDNLTFAADRLFVSNINGQITELLNNGDTRALLPAGLNWPLDLAVGDDGTLYIADGTNLFALAPGGKLQSIGNLFSTNYPGFIRGLVAVGSGTFLCTTSGGLVARYRPASCELEVLAQGYDQLYGLAVAPSGSVVTAELGTGRVLSLSSGGVEVLASGLLEPRGVVFDRDGVCLVSESATGRILRLSSSSVDTLFDGLQAPQGLLVRDNLLYVVDAGSKQLISYDFASKTQRTIARDLPVGAPAGVTPKPLRGVQPFSGPQGPFAGIAAGPDGTLYVSADADGSVLALRQRNN